MKQKFYIVFLALVALMMSSRQVMAATAAVQRDTVYHVETYHLCAGSSLELYGKTYTESAKDTITHSLPGKDSLQVVEVLLVPVYHQYDTIYLGSGEIYLWHDQHIDRSGTYMAWASSDYGCDSIYQLTAIYRPTFLYEENVSICESETPYMWHGLSCSATNIYEDYHTSTQNKDSIYRLNLTVWPAVETEYLIEICPGQSIEYGGQMYNKPGVYDQQYYSEHGCDSIVHVVVNYKNRFIQVDSVGINDSASYTWDITGLTYTEPGRYEIQETNSVGCDSIYRLELYRNKKYFFADTVKVCQPDTLPWYIWRGMPINQSGLYWDSLRTVAGQDSVYHLNITFPTPTDTTIHIDLCASQYYVINGVPVTESKLYVDTITNVNGCDSIVWTSVTIHGYSQEKWDTICDGDTLFWVGDTLTVENYYEKRSSDTIWGCDSVFMMHLTMLYPFTHDSQDTICEAHLLNKEPYLWGPNKRELWGKWNDETGHYEDSIYWNCDHTHYLHLHVLRERRYTDSISLCEGEFVTRVLHTGKTITLTEPGYYYDTIPSGPDHNIFSCDSIVCYHVTVHPIYRDTVVQVVNTNQIPLTVYDNGVQITGPGYYTQTIQTQGKCDSVHVDAISMLTQISRTICEGDSIDFYGTFLKTKGVYTYSFVHHSGLDSTIQLTLNIRPSYRMTQTAHISDQQNYTWRLHDADGTIHEREFTKPVIAGVYTDTLKSSQDCDSIIILTLNVHPTYLMPDTITICQSEVPYIWRGKQLSNNGDYIDKMQTKKWGYDSIYTLHLNIMPVYRTQLTPRLCYGEPFQHNHKIYDKPGLYHDTIGTTIYGCDSIFDIDLKWYDIYTTKLSDHCDSESLPYIWHVGDKDIELTHTGLYIEHLQSYHGCDSTVQMELTVYHTYNYYDTIEVCVNKLPYTWREQVIYKAGDYKDELTTYLGYDSIYHLHLITWTSPETVIHLDTCYGEPVQFLNKTYTLPGVYKDTIVTQSHACDSIFIINVTWRNTYHDVQHAKVDDKHLPYTWHVGDKDIQLTHGGTFFENLQTQSGCDSIIEMNLTVYETYFFEEDLRVCASEIPYQWHSQQLATPGTYYENLTTKLGYDSIYAVHFSIIDTARTDIYYEMCYGGSYLFGRKNLTVAGIYQDTLKNREGCDSIVTLHLQVRPKYAHMEQASIHQDERYYWPQTGKYYTQTGTYADTLTAENGCDSIIMLSLIVYDKEIIIDEGYVEVCSNQLPYRWRGHYLTEPKIYYDTLRNPASNQIYILELRVLDMGSQTHEHVLCDGDYFEWNGKKITHDTLYHDIDDTGLGCGTDHTIFIRFRKAQDLVINAKTDDQHPYKWDVNGQIYSISGSYRHTIRTEDNQCDSIRYTLNLTVGQTYSIYEKMAICENDLPYSWHGQTINGVGIYRDSLETVLHYDSTFVLEVTEILPIYHATKYIQLCEGGKAVYRGKEYTTAGEFQDTIPALNGCDSIIHISVRVFPTKESFEVVDISDKETPYLWNGQTLTKSGPAVAYLKTNNDCDSIAHLTLRIHPTHYIEENIETCDNHNVVWHNKTYQASGTYYDSLSTQIWGYDSIHVMHLTVHPTYFIEEHVELQRGATTTIHGLTITHEGTYNDTLYSIHGCDSIYLITANYPRDYRKEYNDTICDGETYSFYGKEYTKSGTYTELLGKDSIEICHLTVLRKAYQSERIVLFPGQLPYIHNGKEYTQPGIYVDSLLSQNNCDSIYRLELIMSEHYSDWVYRPLCTGETIKIDSITITQAGSYTFVYRSRISGELDSLYRLEVYNAPAYDLPVEEFEICEGDTLLWNNKLYWTTCTDDYNGKTTEGCDSIAHLKLVVHPTYRYYTDATITDYEKYTWRGSEYTQTGEYVVRKPTPEGCDSVFTLRLNVLTTDRKHESDTICQGESFIWRGKTLTKTGIYTDTINLPGSLTSSIYTLELQVITPTNIQNARVKEVCADDEQFEIELNYSGTTPEKYTVLFDQQAKRQGFADLYDEPYHGQILVPMPLQSAMIYQNHYNYVRPDNYTVYLVFDNGACGLSKSEALTLQIRYPSWIIEQFWGDVVAPLKPELNGGYDFAHYEWAINGAIQNTGDRGYIYSTQLLTGDQVVLYATRRGENYAIPTCPLTIEKSDPQNETTPIAISPIIVSRKDAKVKISSPYDATYHLYSQSGMLVQTGKLIMGEQTIDIPATAGCYLIHITTTTSQTESHKIIVN